MKISDAQRIVLERLVRGVSLLSLPPITRKFLVRHGFVTAKPLGGGKWDIAITDAGLKFLREAERT